MIHTLLPVPQIIAGYQAGDSMKTLADKYSVSYGTIRNVLAANQVPIRRPGRGSSATMGDTRQVTAYRYRRPRGETPTVMSADEVARLRQAIGWDSSWGL